LVHLLVYLKSPNVVAKTLELMAAGDDQAKIYK